MGVDWRKHNRFGPIYSIVATNGNRRDILNLPRAPVKAWDFVSAGAVNDVVVQGVRRNITVLDHPDRMPVTKSNSAVIASRRDANRSALLLAAADFVRKRVHHANVIHLRGGLVVPRTPGFPTVHAHQSALISHQKNNVWIFR